MATLSLGDRVLIRSDAAGGYVCADGFYDDVARVAADGVPLDVDSCLFELRPANDAVDGAYGRLRVHDEPVQARELVHLCHAASGKRLVAASTRAGGGGSSGVVLVDTAHGPGSSWEFCRASPAGRLSVHQMWKPWNPPLPAFS